MRHGGSGRGVAWRGGERRWRRQLTPASDGDHRIAVAVADLDARPTSVQKELDDVNVTPRCGRSDRGDSIHVPLVHVGTLPHAPTDHVKVALVDAGDGLGWGVVCGGSDDGEWLGWGQSAEGGLIPPSKIKCY